MWPPMTAAPIAPGRELPVYQPDEPGAHADGRDDQADRPGRPPGRWLGCGSLAAERHRDDLWPARGHGRVAARDAVLAGHGQRGHAATGREQAAGQHYRGETPGRGAVPPNPIWALPAGMTLLPAESIRQTTFSWPESSKTTSV